MRPFHQNTTFSFRCNPPNADKEFSITFSIGSDDEASVAISMGELCASSSITHANFQELCIILDSVRRILPPGEYLMHGVS